MQGKGELWRVYHSFVFEAVDTSWGPTRHLAVERRDGRDGIPWDDLQALKDEYLGPEVCAVEFYPAVGDVVNERNRRHLWEVSDFMVPPLRR